MYKTKLNPMFSELKPMASIFDELINEGLSTVLGAGFATTSPHVNILDEKDAFVIEVAAPGVAKNDFELNLNQNTLTISLKGKEKEGNNEKSFIRREYRLESFEKLFEIPNNVDRNSISAAYENGVLIVSLPKISKEESNISKTIEIK